jgi:hypothetical protein
VLTAEKAFLALALYNTVRLSMTLFFPFAISMIGECRASVDRVADFLLLEERDARHITRTFHPKSQEVTALYMRQGCGSGSALIFGPGSGSGSRKAKLTYKYRKK